MDWFIKNFLMADHIALLDRFRFEDRYFICTAVILRDGQAQTVELLELATRKVYRKSYLSIAEKIKSGELIPWDPDYTFNLSW